MNHIYRIVFNHSLGAYQCVIETAKGQSKSARRSGIISTLASFNVKLLSISISSILVLGTTTSAVANIYNHQQIIDTVDSDTLSADSRTLSRLLKNNDSHITLDPEFYGDSLIIADGKVGGVNTMFVEELTVTGKGSHLYANKVITASKATIADGGLISARFAQGGDFIVTGPTSKLDTKGIHAKNLTFSNGGSSLVDWGFNVDNLIVDGSGSEIISINPSTIGNATISDGGLVVVGEDLRINNKLMVTRSGSLLTGNLSVGSLYAANGGNIQAYNGSVEGELTAADKGRAHFDNILSVGKDTIISNGSSIGAGNDVYIGGKLTVSGKDSSLSIGSQYGIDNSNSLVVGSSVIIEDSGKITAKNLKKSDKKDSSVINFDNGILELTADQSTLFDDFTGDNTINLAAGGGIIDTNKFDVQIFKDARISGIGSFTKAGTGTLTVDSATKAWGGDTHINQGTLQLNGDYIMRGGEVLAVGLNTLDDYGQLIVNGNADISQGQLQVNASEAVQNLAGVPIWNNVVSANSLNGEFAGISDNSPLVSFVADYSDANRVHLKMIAPSVVPPVDPKPPVVDTTFVKAVQSQSNQTALNLARVLDLSITDRLDDNTNALADALISGTTNFDKPKLAAAANELQPLLMGATNRITIDSNYAATEAITERSLTMPKRGLWAKIIGSDSRHDTNNGVTGYEADSYGAIVGIDSPINDRLSLGVAMSYINSDVNSNSGTLNHELTAKNWQVLGYGNYAVTDATQVDIQAGAGSSDVKGKRHLAILTNTTAEADYSVDTLQAGLGIGHRIGNELRHVTPFAKVNYARAKSEGYRETGAGVYNLNVDENTYESTRWTAGVKMSQALTPKLALTGQLAAAFEDGDRRSDITARFTSMPDANFTTSGQEIGREIGIAGIGLSYMPTANTKLSAGYHGEWRDNYNDQGASIALKTSF